MGALQAHTVGGPSQGAVALDSKSEEALTLTLLDWGLAEELTPQVRHHFISFLHCISSGVCLILHLALYLISSECKLGKGDLNLLGGFSRPEVLGNCDWKHDPSPIVVIRRWDAGSRAFAADGK